MPDPTQPRDRAGRRAKRFLSPSEKYHAFVSVLCGDMTVAQCAEYWGVDRSTILKAREVAKQGALDALASSRPGARPDGVDPELVAARREIARLSEAVKEMAIKLTLLEGKSAGGDGPGAPRVDARVKAGLLELLDDAVEQGWSGVRAAAVLELDERRARRWRGRLGHLDDGVPGRAVHGLLPAEVEAIIAVFERFGDIDLLPQARPPRSYEGLVWVSESTVYRVLAAQGLVLPLRHLGRPPRRRRRSRSGPEWRPNQIWIYDFTHFTRAERVAFAVMDVVSRKWLNTVVTTEESAARSKCSSPAPSTLRASGTASRSVGPARRSTATIPRSQSCWP